MTLREHPLPLVTAVVVCYNQAKYVVEALESVKAQAYPRLHMVVADDCSTDNSAEIIKQWLNRNSPDAIFLQHKTNMGVCRTLNEALSHVRGKYFRLLAADDIWTPNSLLRQIETLEMAPDDVGVLYSDAFQIDKGGELLPKMFIESHRSFAKMPEGWIFDILLEGNFIPAMTAVIRHSCIERVGRADENLVSEDWDLWVRIARQFKFQYFPEPTALYRIVSTSMMRTMSPAILESEERMFVKYLRLGWLAGRNNEEVISREYWEACRAYREGLPGRVAEAAWSFRHRVCIKHALLLISVVVGLPYKRFEQLMTFLINLNGRAKTFLANLRIRRVLR